MEQILFVVAILIFMQLQVPEINFHQNKISYIFENLYSTSKKGPYVYPLLTEVKAQTSKEQEKAN